MMSKKCKYALKALVTLGKEYGSEDRSIDQIAKAAGVPRKFLELILLDLKRGGYVQSRRGSRGGYHLVKEPKAITLAEIYRFFDGAIALQPCVSLNFYERCDDCPNEDACALKPALLRVRRETARVMAGITLHSMLSGGGRRSVKDD